jgi:hypothetical protein
MVVSFAENVEDEPLLGGAAILSARLRRLDELRRELQKRGANHKRDGANAARYGNRRFTPKIGNSSQHGVRELHAMPKLGPSLSNRAA